MSSLGLQPGLGASTVFPCPNDFRDNFWVWIGLGLNFKIGMLTKYVDLGTLQNQDALSIPGVYHHDTSNLIVEPPNV